VTRLWALGSVAPMRADRTGGVWAALRARRYRHVGGSVAVGFARLQVRRPAAMRLDGELRVRAETGAAHLPCACVSQFEGGTKKFQGRGGTYFLHFQQRQRLAVGAGHLHFNGIITLLGHPHLHLGLSGSVVASSIFAGMPLTLSLPMIVGFALAISCFWAGRSRAGRSSASHPTRSASRTGVPGQVVHVHLVRLEVEEIGRATALELDADGATVAFTTSLGPRR